MLLGGERKQFDICGAGQHFTCKDGVFVVGVSTFEDGVLWIRLGCKRVRESRFLSAWASRAGEAALIRVVEGGVALRWEPRGTVPTGKRASRGAALTRERATRH